MLIREDIQEALGTNTRKHMEAEKMLRKSDVDCRSNLTFFSLPLTWFDCVTIVIHCQSFS